MRARLVFHILAICGAASFAGAMLLIGMVFGAYWTTIDPADFLVWFSAHSHLIGRTIPLFAVPTLVGLVASLWLSRGDPSAWFWWIGALACLVGVFLVTSLVHLPMNSQFDTRAVPIEHVGAMLKIWLWWHVARVVLGFSAAVMSILAVARQSRGVRTAFDGAMRTTALEPSPQR